LEQQMEQQQDRRTGTGAQGYTGPDRRDIARRVDEEKWARHRADAAREQLQQLQAAQPTTNTDTAPADHPAA
jgi:hypothetical protein